MQEIICDHLWVCLSLHTVPQVRNPGTWKSVGLRFTNCALNGLAASICESGKGKGLQHIDTWPEQKSGLGSNDLPKNEH